MALIFDLNLRSLRNRAKSLLVVAALFLLANAAFGSTLADYRERVESSQKSIETMISVVENQRSFTDADSYLSQTTASVKKALPETENVEFQGSSIDASNGWVRSRLDEFDRTRIVDERITILSSISER